MGTKDAALQGQVMKDAAAATAAVHGTQYQTGPIYSTVYPVTGDSADWAYGVQDVVFTFAVELRDQGEYGFMLPPNQIIPQGEEIIPFVKVMGEAVLKNPNIRKPSNKQLNQKKTELNTEFDLMKHK